MRACFRIGQATLDLIASEVGLDERSMLSADAIERFGSWITRYHLLLGRADVQADFLSLGRDLYGWLDGGQGWLERLTGLVEPPLALEFQAASPLDAMGEAFLQVPWELLANAAGHLAADPVFGFCPVRRVGLAQPSAGPASDLCLGLVFMAAAPRGQHELDYEAEENAILTATRDLGPEALDLEVEESGNPSLLAARLAAVEQLQALHLSCHGQSKPEPALMLEDSEGNSLRTTAVDLLRVLPQPRPRLLFLSACETAQRGSVSGPLAVTMVRAGVPAVLGWDGSVLDTEAIEFARELYWELSRRSAVEVAVGAARGAQFRAGRERPASDWHLARLWLGPRGGGVLVGGTRRRRLLDLDNGHQQFLRTSGERLPVASRDAFVGRRREVQKGLQILRDGKYPGLFIHGMGRLGKSSLAARLAHRRPDLELAIIYERYDAISVLQTIQDACPQAAGLIGARKNAVRDHPEQLEEVLRAILEGPCQQAGGAGKPLLLVIDDLERILEPSHEGERHRVAPAYVPVLRGVMRAFARAQGRTQSRLVLTSRYRFTLPSGTEPADLGEAIYALQLRPMPEAGARKQALRRLRQAATEQPQQDRGIPRAGAVERDLVDRCIGSARGNPGLQDLLVGLALKTPARAGLALDELNRYFDRGTMPGHAQLHDFLDSLQLERLLLLLSPGERALLRSLTAFEQPLPFGVAHGIAKTSGGTIERLLSLGLCDRFEDMVDTHAPAIAVNALVRPLAGPPNDIEAKVLVASTLDPLFQAWGSEKRQHRPYPADVELTRLALMVENVPVLLACATDALAWLEMRSAYRQAAAWGKQALEILDRRGAAPSLALLRRFGEVCLRSGDAAAAQVVFGRAVERVSAGEAETPLEHGALLLAQARLLEQNGNPDQALALFEQVRGMAAMGQNPRHAAAFLGGIARIRADRGEWDAALTLHQERLDALAVLKDRRLHAMTLGDIGRIKGQKGEIDQALALHEAALREFEDLGDERERAIALGDIARIRRRRGEIEEALGLHRTELGIYEALHDEHCRAVTLCDIARIMNGAGDVDEALKLHQDALSVFERLGDPRSGAVAKGLIARIMMDKGELDQALTLCQEQLQSYEQLGDPRLRAMALVDIARIVRDKGDTDEALSLFQKALDIFDALPDPRERAVTLNYIGRLKAKNGEIDTALAIHRGNLAVFETLRDRSLCATTLGDIAHRTAEKGDIKSALALYQEALRELEALKDMRETALMLGCIAGIKSRMGEFDEALVLHRKALVVFEKLGDPRLCAATRGYIAKLRPDD